MIGRCVAHYIFVFLALVSGMPAAHGEPIDDPTPGLEAIEARIAATDRAIVAAAKKIALVESGEEEITFGSPTMGAFEELHGTTPEDLVEAFQTPQDSLLVTLAETRKDLLVGLERLETSSTAAPPAEIRAVQPVPSTGLRHCELFVRRRPSGPGATPAVARLAAGGLAENLADYRASLEDLEARYLKSFEIQAEAVAMITAWRDRATADVARFVLPFHDMGGVKAVLADVDPLIEGTEVIDEAGNAVPVKETPASLDQGLERSAIEVGEAIAVIVREAEGIADRADKAASALPPPPEPAPPARRDQADCIPKLGGLWYQTREPRELSPVRCGNQIFLQHEMNIDRVRGILVQHAPRLDRATSERRPEIAEKIRRRQTQADVPNTLRCARPLFSAVSGTIEDRTLSLRFSRGQIPATIDIVMNGALNVRLMETSGDMPTGYLRGLGDLCEWRVSGPEAADDPSLEEVQRLLAEQQKTCGTSGSE